MRLRLYRTDIAAYAISTCMTCMSRTAARSGLDTESRSIVEHKRAFDKFGVWLGQSLPQGVGIEVHFEQPVPVGRREQVRGGHEADAASQKMGTIGQARIGDHPYDTPATGNPPPFAGVRLHETAPACLDEILVGRFASQVFTAGQRDLRTLAQCPPFLRGPVRGQRPLPATSEAFPPSGPPCRPPW